MKTTKILEQIKTIVTKIAFFAMVFCLFFGMLTNMVFGQPAFPGAEGFGASSVGGRGGQVIKVTNLNDNGPGSFRVAVTASGPRIVVFDVSGIINLSSNITINNPYLTIAGQTSPGGTLITGRRFIVNTHDVIIRYIRFRVGTHGGLDPEINRAFEIYGDGMYSPNPGYNIIVDHCSFSWAADQILSAGEDATNITFQWNIISEGLRDAGHPDGYHSMGFLIWGKYDTDTKYSLHHNYFAHNNARNPEINYNAFADVVNNVVYDMYGGNTMRTHSPATVNWVHNYIKTGPSTDRSGNTIYEAGHSYSDGDQVVPSIYAEGNIGTKRTQDNPEQWYVGVSWRDQLLNEGWRRMTPWEASYITTTTMSYDYALEILQNVGAVKPFRDDVDTRVVADFDAETGAIIDNVTYPDDFPTFQNLPAPADNDNDGISDIWETVNGLNPNDPADYNGTDLSDEGYTNIEMYINELADSTDSSGTTSMIGQDGAKGQQNNILMSYPNPFTSSTTIKYSIAELCEVQMKIYNQLGQEVYVLVNEQKTAGEHNVTWNGKDASGNKLPGGIYYYRLTAGKQSFSNKMFYKQ